MRWLAAALLLAGLAPADAEVAAAGHRWLAAEVARLEEGHSPATPAVRAQSLVDRAVDLEAFTHAALGGYVGTSLAEFADHLGADEMGRYADLAHGRLRAALGRRLSADLAAHLAAGDIGPLTLVGSRFDGDGGTVELRAAGPAPLRLVCHARYAGGAWRLVDLEVNGLALSAWYRRRYAEAIRLQYSPAVLEAEIDGREYVVLESFGESSTDGMPIGWRWRERDENRPKPYAVAGSEGARYLAAHDRGESVILLKFSHWSPRRYPIMTWCWRAEALPAGGDERFGHTNDSAAGIYVVFSQNWLGLPRQIKYVWSTLLPEGATDRRERVARPWFVVVESGADRVGQWTFEVVDLERDYERTYGGVPRERTQGLGLLTDANSTGSYAEAYYADLRVWTRQAYDAGWVQDTCDCFRQLGAVTGGGAAGAAAGTPTRTTP